MSIYYHGNGQSWQEYLQTQSFVDDITGGIKREAKNINRSIDSQTSSMLASNNVLRTTISDGIENLDHSIRSGFGSLENSINSGFDRIEYGLSELSDGIEGLRADFNWGMGQLIDRVDTMLMMQDKTNNILLSVLSEVSKYDDEKKIRGYIEQGLKNYNAGAEFMHDALTYFHKAEELLPANDMPFLLYKLGQIYLYNIDTIDFDKSRKYFNDAAKYYRRDNENKKASESYLFAGITAYLQKDIQNAVKYSKQAMELNPDMLEAYYNHAKYLAAQKNSDGLDNLEIAVRKDRNYVVKAFSDGDFENISEQLRNLIEKLRQEAAKKAELDISNAEKMVDEYLFFDEGLAVKKEIDELLLKAKISLSNNTYFDYLDALGATSEVKKKLIQLLSSNINIREIRTLSGHSSTIYSVAFSPDGSFALTISGDFTVRLWEVSSGRKIRTLFAYSQNIYLVAFSPDGSLALTGSGNKTAKLMEVSSGREIRTLSGHSYEIKSVAFSPDGSFALTGSDDKTAKLWEVSSGREIRTLSGHSSTIYSVAFSPDGSLALTGSGNKTAKLWEVASGKEIRTLSGHSSTIYSVAFSPDGSFALTGSGDKTAKLWEVSSGREIRTLSGHSYPIRSVAFSPDGSLALTGSEDKTAKLWEVSSGKEIRMLSGHSSTIYSVAFSPDGSFALTGSDDKTAKLWAIEYLIMPKAEMLRREETKKNREREVEAIRLKNESQRLACEQIKSEQRKDDWRRSGRCDKCGIPLGFWDKFTNKLQCKRCRN